MKIYLGDCIIILDLKLEMNSSSRILVLTVLNITVLWDVKLYSLVDSLNVLQNAASIFTVEK